MAGVRNYAEHMEDVSNYAEQKVAATMLIMPE
jgi:hypothetical protein